VTSNEASAFASTRRDKVMGFVVLSAFLGLLYLVFFQSDMSAGTASEASYHTWLSQSYGITAGGSVAVSGVSVGTVQNVTLESDGRVRLQLYLNPKYAGFYRAGSRLKIDSQLGISSVIGGGGLLLLPGPENAGLLPPGSELPTEEPESLQQLVEDFNVREMADTLSAILQDIGEIVASVRENQTQLIAALDHTSQVSANMAEATAGMPQLMANVDTLLLRLDNTLEGLDQQAGTLGEDLRDTMAQTAELTESLTALVSSVEPTARRSPVLVDNLIQVSRETEILLNRLNHHWLLGGGGQAAAPGPRLDIPGDDTLYEMEEIGMPGDRP
jgi:ABC-type transporter Mla subunit MlaD